MASTPDYQQLFRTCFATRLTSKLREMGLVSRRGTNGVNGQKLANAIGVSLPMARRYINGQSIPENSTLQKISNWLDVDPCWLLYGENNVTCTPHKPIDKELFKEIFEQMYPILCKPDLTKEQYISLIMACLEIYGNITSMEKADKPKSKAIALMVDFLKKNL